MYAPPDRSASGAIWVIIYSAMRREPIILVIDTPPSTADLLRFAAAWSGITTGASVKLLRVIDEKVLKDTTMAVDAVGPIARMIRDDLVRKSVEEIESLLGRYGLDTVVKPGVTVGNLMEEITKAVDEARAEFVILSSSLRRPIGSIVAEVVGHSRSNSVVLPAGVHGLSWERILLATDCSVKSESAAKTALEAAGTFGSILTILSVISSNEEVQIHAPALLDRLTEERRAHIRRLVEQARDMGVRAEGIVREGAVPDILVEVAGDVRADMVIMGSEGRTGLQRLFMGSVAGSIVNRVSCPVLVIKEPFTFRNPSGHGPSRRRQTSA
ncbi:MAG TPA: universal stress protein [Nitrospirae bacterium]|nr:universal stress protein [Nitrospirota bacterium]